MGLFSTTIGLSAEDRTSRWRHELIQHLSGLLTREDDFGLSAERSQVVVRRDSAFAFIGFDFDEEDNGYLVLSAPLVFLSPEKSLPVYQKLLELNDHDLLIGRLAIAGNLAVLRCTLPVEGLSEETFTATLTEVLAEAEFLDDDLSQEFGLRRFGAGPA